MQSILRKRIRGKRDEAVKKTIDKTIKRPCGHQFSGYGYPDLLAGIYKIYPENPSTWSEELVSYLFAWMSLLGASLITSERGHMNIPVVVERMPQAMKKGFPFC